MSRFCSRDGTNPAVVLSLRNMPNYSVLRTKVGHTEFNAEKLKVNLLGKTQIMLGTAEEVGSN